MITHLKVFGLIPKGDRALIAAAFRSWAVREDDYLFKGGRVCRELFFVEEGVLRIMMTNSKGIEVTHYFLRDNQFCTILNSFDKEVLAGESIQAACDSQVLAISRTDLLGLYENFSYLKELIDQSLHTQLLKKIQLRNSYLGLDAKARYQLFVEQQPEVARRISSHDIASYLEITPQSLSRIRKSR